MRRQLKVEMPEQESATLKSFAADEGVSEGEALRRAIALLALARREQQKGRRLGVVVPGDDGDWRVIAEVKGV